MWSTSYLTETVLTNMVCLILFPVICLGLCTWWFAIRSQRKNMTRLLASHPMCAFKCGVAQQPAKKIKCGAVHVLQASMTCGDWVLWYVLGIVVRALVYLFTQYPQCLRHYSGGVLQAKTINRKATLFCSHSNDTKKQKSAYITYVQAHAIFAMLQHVKESIIVLYISNMTR